MSAKDTHSSASDSGRTVISKLARRAVTVLRVLILLAAALGGAVLALGTELPHFVRVDARDVIDAAPGFVLPAVFVAVAAALGVARMRSGRAFLIAVLAGGFAFSIIGATQDQGGVDGYFANVQKQVQHQGTGSSLNALVPPGGGSAHKTHHTGKPAIHHRTTRVHKPVRKVHKPVVTDHTPATSPTTDVSASHPQTSSTEYVDSGSVCGCSAPPSSHVSKPYVPPANSTSNNYRPPANSTSNNYTPPAKSSTGTGTYKAPSNPSSNKGSGVSIKGTSSISIKTSQSSSSSSGGAGGTGSASASASVNSSGSGGSNSVVTVNGSSVVVNGNNGSTVTVGPNGTTVQSDGSSVTTSTSGTSSSSCTTIIDVNGQTTTSNSC